MYQPDQQPSPPVGGHPPAPTASQAYPPSVQPPYPAQPPYGYPAGPGAPGAVPPGAPPQGSVPPGAVPPGYAPYPQPASPKRHGGLAWLWWLAGIMVALVLFSCVIATIASLGGGGSGGFSTGDKVAVIPISGTIAGTGSAPSVTTPEDFLKLLKRAEKDDSVKAVVLRINSPGGTVAASQEISAYVKQATKPVVVSVGDVDASGAYMVSSQARRIIANPGSAVGSIGVILEVPNVSGLMDKLGVQFKVIHSGKYKDAGSPFRSLTATETGMLQDQLDQVYNQFIDTVATGRKLPRSEVASLATGWAWNAVEAKQLGLVDQIGTYQDALDTAAKLGGIQGGYQTEVYETTQLPGLLGTLLGLQSQLQNLGAATQVDPASLKAGALAK